MLFLAILFYVDKLVLGPWAGVRIHDVFDSDYCRYGFMEEMVFRHGMVSWFPNYAGGIPAYAWHYPPYYILCLLTGVLPVWLIYGVMCVSLMAAAGWGMFRLLRERLNLSAQNAFFGALFFELITQVQPNNIPQLIFNYAFPLFHVWSLDVLEWKHQPRRAIKPLAGVLLILMASYPILTLPHFALLQFVLVGLDGRIMHDRRKAVATCLGLGVLWLGYAVSYLPVFYTLLGYAPEVARHFETWKLPGVQDFYAFLISLVQHLVFVSCRTTTFVPLIAGMGLLAISPRLRKYFSLWACCLSISAFFDSPLARVFAGTLVEKMDLAHFSWIVPFAAALVVAISVEEVLSNPEHASRYRKLLGLGLVVLVVLKLAGAISSKTLALNLCAGIAQALIMNREQFDRGLKAFSVFSITSRRAAAVLVICGILITLICVFRFRACEIPNLLVFAWLARMLWKHSRGEQASLSGWERRTVLAVGTAGLLVLFSFRLCRFGGDEPENTPYKAAMENYSFLRTLRTQEAGLWRAGAVDGMWPGILVHNGWETVDARGPIFNGRYKEFFKRIVQPQLTNKKDEEFFDSYWYDLSLMNGNRKLEYNWPLLALANVKYLVSSEPSLQLQNASESVRTVSLDSQAALRAWADKAGAALPFLKKNLRRMTPAKFYYIYTLKDTLPRGFLAHHAAVLKNDREVLAALSSSSIGELKDKVCFSESDTSPDEIRVLTIGNNRRAEGSSADVSTLTRYSPDRMEFRLSLSTPAALVVSDNFNRHWKATVNGAASKVFRADHAFQAVLLPQAGNYQVVLEYDDPWLGITHLGIVAGVLLIVSPLAFGLRRERQQEGTQK